MSSRKNATTIPIIGFIVHRLKLLAKSRLFSAIIMDDLKQKKKKSEKSKAFDLNLLPRVNLSKPINILGHILMWYNIPVLFGIIMSLIYGYYFETYVRFVDYFGLNIIVKIIALMIGLMPIGLIVALVALMRTFEEEFDVVGDGRYLYNAQDLPKLVSNLDWSSAEPEVESANWIRDLLEQLWSNLNIFAIRMVSIMFPNCSLDPILGPVNQITKFEIKKLFLGEKVPKITGIHVMNRGVKREDLIIDCEFTFDSDLEIQIIGNYDIDFGVDWFYFKAKTRLLLTPLFSDLPVVGNLQISLLEKPKINWHFTGLLAILNWDFLKSCVECVVSYFVGNPRFFAVNLAKVLPTREMKLREPIGFLRIEILSAKNVERPQSGGALNCLRKPDPYCKIEVENESMSTSIIKNDSNPEWNQQFCLMVHNSILNPLILSIFDEDLIEDKLIGRFSLPIKEFVDNRQLNGREISVPLTLNGRRIETLEPPITDKRSTRMAIRVSWFKLTNDVKLLDHNLRLSRTQLPVAVLSVLIDSASGLDTCTVQVRSPELRPIVKISVGNQMRFTTCKRRTGCPVWEEAFHFILYNPIWENIRIEVIDMYWVEEKQLLPFIPLYVSSFGTKDILGLSSKGTVLGTYEISTNEVLKAHKMKLEGSYRLNGYVENGFIRLLTTIRIAEFESHVIENIRKPRVQLAYVVKLEKQRQEAKEMKEKQLKEVIDCKTENKSFKQLSADHTVQPVPSRVKFEPKLDKQETGRMHS